MADDRFERLANLVTYLLDAGEGGNGASYADIVSAIPGYPEGEESRRRAFERDKKLLRDEDLPLVEQDGRYWIPPDEYYLPDLALTEDEQLALQLAVAAVPVSTGEGGEAGAALQKLSLASGGGLDLGDGLAAAGGPLPVADLDEHPLLPVLHGAIRRRATVTFSHRGTERTVEPVRLFFRGGNWYLFAFDRLRDAERNFRVDRIEGDVAVGPPASFDARASAAARSTGEAMPHEPWLYGAGADEEPEQARVRVDAVLAAKAVRGAGASASVERHDDGSVTLTMPVRHREAFRSWVLGMLDHAEVVGPPALRDDVVRWLRGLAG